MDTSFRTKVSLRGASSKEITRDALLEKAALEREIRSQTRKAAAAAQLIQRVWRGHSAVSKASDILRSEWDKYVADVWKVQDDVPNPLLCKTILRPLLFFFGVSCYKVNTRRNRDLERLVTCITIVLKSINSEDSSYNYCSLSTGTMEERMTWFYQMHKLMHLCCVGLVEGSAWSNYEMSKLANLSVRMLVVLTDSSLWHYLKQDETKAEAKMVVQKLLEWIAHKNCDFYPAIATCILKSCHSRPEDLGHSDKFQKEKFIVVASAITLALRPLQILTSELSDKTYQKVQEAFCSHILTISLITERLPAAMVPALQHPSVLTPSLKTFETLNIGQVPLKPSDRDISSSGWALINVVSLAKNSKKDEFVKDLALQAYVRAVCSLLDQLELWVENLRHECKNGGDVFSLVCTGPSKYDGSDESCALPGAARKLTDKLEPLYQQWHLKELLDRSDLNFSSSKVNVKKIEGVASDTPTLKLPDIVMLYSKLLNVCTMLQSGQRSSPVLNVLAFAPGFLLQIWDWLDEALGLTRSCDAKNVEAIKYSDSGTSHRKDDKSGGVLSTRWASAMSKIKGKGSTSEMLESEKTYTEQFDKEDVMRKWNFDSGPGNLPNEVLSMLKLFCAAYGHLLVILDDDEFYERQVPFTLKQQRVIVAFLNSLVYHGLCSPGKQNFMPLMGSAIKCLNSLYGRDCRRSFCHPSLWLSPAVSNRPPIPASARAHEVAMASIKNGEFSQAPPIGYVLTLTPHVIPFEDRVQIFREFIKSDKMTRKMAGEIMGPGPGSIEIAIRRDHLIEDAFAQLNSLGSKLKSSINVSFVNEYGLAEAGLDYGGLFKEFLTDLAKAAFDPGYGLFAQNETEEGFLFPHPAAGSLQHGLPMIEFLGRIVGKAMYEGILLDYSFSHVFIRKLLGHYIFLDELSTLDPELHQSLMYLKHYDGDVKELALDFTITEELFGRRTIVELVPGGANIPVTNENKLQYVHAMADYKLNRQMQPLISAFSRGLSDIISPSWLSLFNAKELNQLLSGGEHDFDVDDLKANTKYTGGFTENSRTVKQFWEVLREFEPKERCALLKFVTSCSRAPLLGFKYLQPAFTIHKVNCDTTLWAMLGGQDVDRLPTASTCYNTLKLPTYKRMSTLRSKLRYAINSNAGFELS